MTIAQEFDREVRAYLELWGREFPLWQNVIPLGHKRRDVLYDAMRHGGAPPKVTGYKPTVIPEEAQLVEDAIRALHFEAPALATCMRHAYCGSGRRGVERFHDAQRACHEGFSRRTFFRRLDLGFVHVARWILARRRARSAA